MGKGIKNKTNQIHEMQEQGGQSSAENSSQQKKNEEEEEEEEESNKLGNKLNHTGVIVLGVFIHCQGCADTIVKCLRGFDGVEVIEIDSKSDKVTVKGAKADPMKVVERIEKKTGKHVELISPVLPKEKKEENKKIQPKLVEVTLKLHLHCEGCAKDVKHVIHKMQGVQTVEADMKNSMVKVMGSFEAEKMVKFIGKRTGRHAVLVKVLEKKEGGGGGGGGKEDENRKKQQQQQSEGNHNQKGTGGKRESSILYPNYYHPDLVYAPQLFSDENPNSCSLM